MWRRAYLVLVFVRIYFALCPSYIHPDENFQGPEVIAGSFGFPSRKTWEWTSTDPIRSVFPLWPVYGFPIVLLQWLWPRHTVDPSTIYYTLRLVMFVLSFVLEDWAIHELVHSPRLRKQAVVLVASSYVTWTLQTHTFSNSVETLVVLWSLVLIERIRGEQRRSCISSCIILGFLLVFGTFNRITFPTFVMIPGMKLVPHFWNRPFCLITLILSIMLWCFIAIAVDTAFYTGPAATESFRALFFYLDEAPVITPLNNVRYNTQTSNLAEHGLHPHYQHMLANLPQLLGPALPVLLASFVPFTFANLKSTVANSRFTSATASIAILSIIPHQELRFLLPCVPLLLTCFRLPTSPRSLTTFWSSWAIFNVLMGLIFGIYHQGGVISSVLSLPSLIPPALNATGSNAHNIEVFYWKTYPPPTYLLGATPPSHPNTNQSLNISVVPLMGIPQSELVFMLMQHFPTCDPGLVEYLSPHPEPTEVLVAAPLSAWRLPSAAPGESAVLLDPGDPNFSIHFPDQRARLGMRSLGLWKKHLNLDDLDVGEEGIVGAWRRTVRRRGLAVWRVERICEARETEGSFW